MNCTDCLHYNACLGWVGNEDGGKDFSKATRRRNVIVSTIMSCM